MKNTKFNFKQTNHEVLEVKLIQDLNCPDYIFVNGFFTFQTEYNGKKVDIELQNGNSLYQGNYNLPSNDYSLYAVWFDDKEESLYDLDENYPDLYNAINDLIIDCNNTVNDDPEDYTYEVWEMDENGMPDHKISDSLSYNELLDLDQELDIYVNID